MNSIVGRQSARTLGEQSLSDNRAMTKGTPIACGAEYESTPISGTKVTHVIQGEYKTSSDPDEVMSTLLGSCVATCLFDPVAGVGGMNHFLLPGSTGKDQMEFRYGLYAMELLINALLKLGAERHRLEAKLFGGAKMHDGLGQIGESNGTFALEYLRAEDIQCVSSSLGGVHARKIRFIPTTGKAQQMLLRQDALPPVARKPATRPDPNVELF